MKGEGETGKRLAWFCPKKTSQAYQQLEITHLLSFSFISSSNLKYINYRGVIAVMCWTISGEGVVTYCCCPDHEDCGSKKEEVCLSFVQIR